MRHTRNRQQAKVSGKLFYLSAKSQEISKWNKHEKTLDPTFKWHRLGGDNWIECNKQVTEWYVGTAVIPIK